MLNRGLAIYPCKQSKHAIGQLFIQVLPQVIVMAWSRADRAALILVGALIVVATLAPKLETTTVTKTVFVPENVYIPVYIPSPPTVIGTAPLVRETTVVVVSEGTQATETKLIRMGVRVWPGSRRVALAFPPCPETDTMMSLMTARYVAETETGISFERLDMLFYSESPADIMRGSSASAAATILIMAAVENKSIDNSYVISAEVTYGGRLDPVGCAEEKMAAVSQAGYTLVVSSNQPEYLPGVVRVSNIRELASLVLKG